MNIHLNDDAVSPVIGTALLVALVVIFASISAAYIFGFMGDQKNMKVVGISGQSNQDGTATFTIQGGGDLPMVENVTARYQDGSSEEIFGSRPSVGDSVVPSRTVTGERVILVGYFEDGAQQVVYDGQF